MTDQNGLISGHFRKGFMWGTATASYQIEGIIILVAIYICGRFKVFRT